ncbi:PAS domain S-box protein [Cupriavidus sp. CuC1]|uniref:PAS domain S-box protein n=1 Tax=Cupriavidus sp. CuC1 TaxID=3373131 RepID=UPI0037D65D20
MSVPDSGATDHTQSVSSAPPFALLDEHFRLLVEGIENYAIYLLDPIGRVTSWNPGAEKIKGYTSKEIIGRHFSAFYTEEGRALGAPERELREAARCGRLEDEGWRVRKDGTRFWANVVIAALRHPNGEIWGYAKITRDLTERRRTEEALRQSEETLRLLVEGVKDYAIFLLDPQGNVMTWNPGAESIKGYRRDEIIGRHFSTFYPAEDIAAGKPARELLQAEREGSLEDEGWRVRKDGTLFWANVIITAVYDAEKRLRGFAKVTRDMSERKRLAELEASSQRMNEFLATLSHELRNPLAPIRNAVNAIALQPENRSVVDRCHALIDRQVTHLTRLVDDLLDVGRITAGKVQLRIETVDIREIIELGVEAARPTLDARSQQISLNLPTTPTLMEADRTRLTQIVQNLVLNASKFSPPSTSIEVNVVTASRQLTISITDQGCGLPPDSLDSIFNLFVQDRRWHGSHEGGLGIGLSVCRSLVELHGGTISAASKGLGKGSTFTIRLPYRPAALQLKDAGAGTAKATKPSLRILIVDDNRDSADSLAMLLELQGHLPTIAYDGPHALAIAEKCRPQIAFIDLAMPGMSGYAVVRALKNLPQLSDTRFVAMTGFGQPDDHQRSRDAGFDFHVVKPIELPTILELVERTLAIGDSPRTNQRP